ncbi:MAG TPA: type II toxin-antitoxin system CcdA family antitoxin [Dermatophilaceae bacterium]|nr:type II toxin-antitoxin system CcdA family antitoxin [Dermatophilaceae bacterium]
MAKRKVTVTVDEELVDAVHSLGAESLSQVVNAALGNEVDRRARSAALAALVADWEARFGPVSSEDEAWACAAFDDVDGAAADLVAPAGSQRGAPQEEAVRDGVA